MTEESLGKPVTLAFDVYGTLIDTHGVVVALEKHAEQDSIDRVKEVSTAINRMKLEG